MIQEEFYNNLSLYKLVPTLAIETLKVASESYYNGGGNIPSVLIHAPARGLGSYCISKAYSNSFGLEFKLGIAEAFSYPSEIERFFGDHPNDCAYYISGAEKLNVKSQEKIYRLITTNVLHRSKNIDGTMQEPLFISNPLVIISTNNPNSITPELQKVLGVHVRLQLFNRKQIIKALVLKSSFYGFRSSISSLEFIAEQAKGNLGTASSHWFLAAKIMKSQDKQKMDISHVKKAMILRV